MKRKNIWIRVLSICMAMIMTLAVLSIAAAAENEPTTDSECKHVSTISVYNNDRTLFQNGTKTTYCTACDAKIRTDRIQFDWTVVGNNIASLFDSSIQAREFDTEGLSIFNTVTLWALGGAFFVGRIAFEPMRIVINLFYHIEK